MMKKLAVPNEALKYILFQRTEYQRFPTTFTYRVINKILPFSIYKRGVHLEARTNRSRLKASYEDDMRKEYLSIMEYLPETCSSILDIGCGIAGIDVFLNRHYEDNKPVFYLLDKTHTDKKVSYGFKAKASFYNSLDIARKMLIENGITERCVSLVEATDNNDITIDGNLDLVISLISWGYHYPVETYLGKVYELLNEGGSLIIDVRKKTNGMDLIYGTFGEVDEIVDGEEFKRVLASK